MFDFIKNLFKTREGTDFDMLIKEGAVIVDVRSADEYQKGHFSGSLNIPMNKLPGKLAEMKKDKILILCCATGIRSSVACSTLLSMGFSNVYNGGIWNSLRKFENEYKAQLSS